jgi:hypothetical protein
LAKLSASVAAAAGADPVGAAAVLSELARCRADVYEDPEVRVRGTREGEKEA